MFRLRFILLMLLLLLMSSCTRQQPTKPTCIEKGACGSDPNAIAENIEFEQLDMSSFPEYLFSDGPKINIAKNDLTEMSIEQLMDLETR